MLSTPGNVEPWKGHPKRLIQLASGAFVVLLIGCSDEALHTVDDPVEDAGGAESGDDTLGPCFEWHLEEAIQLNESRRPKYSSITSGASEPISDTLIGSEKVSLYFAQQVDEAAAPFHQAGVRIACDEFISIGEAPEFSEHYSFDPEPLAAFEAVDGAQMSDELEAAFAEGGFEALSEHAGASILRLAEPRAYHCMVRHVLESLRRIANLAPVHEARAKQAGMDGALAISEEMVRLHLLSLDAAAKLDAQAAPVQSEGVPILCRDVPSIPAGP